MKLGMAVPDLKNEGKSEVRLTFEQALEYIKKIDNITQNITKIYYLVGWQYLGHDDKYPDFFEVNEALKRKEDKTALESFEWFSNEAKKYHSIISVHINFNDAYDNAPSFDDFVKANALIRKRNGEIDALERYNGKKCYKTCLKTYWESGLFKRQIDRFIDTFPFIAKTIVAYGLEPSFGIHHKSQLNQFNLADDIIEPYRPIIDNFVYQNHMQWNEKFLTSQKAELQLLLNSAAVIDGSRHSVANAIELTVQSIISSFESDDIKLKLPDLIGTSYFNYD